MKDIFTYSTKKVLVTFGLVIICIYAYRFLQPQCEPCPPGTPCPPCISIVQIFIATVGGVLSVYVILLIAMPRREK